MLLLRRFERQCDTLPVRMKASAVEARKLRLSTAQVHPNAVRRYSIKISTVRPFVSGSNASYNIV